MSRDLLVNGKLPETSGERKRLVYTKVLEELKALKRYPVTKPYIRTIDKTVLDSCGRNCVGYYSSDNMEVNDWVEFFMALANANILKDVDSYSDKLFSADADISASTCMDFNGRLVYNALIAEGAMKMVKGKVVAYSEKDEDSKPVKKTRSKKKKEEVQDDGWSL